MLKALKDLVNDPPYNYGFHLAIDPDAKDYYHWHLEVYPKLTTWAGFEKSTGMYINTVTPETAAELKKTLQLTATKKTQLNFCPSKRRVKGRKKR
jgi:galactose-1-phosphate uridylyltransferase